MSKHPAAANSAGRFGVVWLCFCAPNCPNQAENCLFCCPSTSKKSVILAVSVSPQAPYGEYFCCLSCPSTLATVLIVLVWFGCVSVLQIARKKLKIAFFAVVNKQETRYFGSLSLLPRPPMVNIFVAYHAQAPYHQC